MTTHPVYRRVGAHLRVQTRQHVWDGFTVNVKERNLAHASNVSGAKLRLYIYSLRPLLIEIVEQRAQYEVIVPKYRRAQYRKVVQREELVTCGRGGYLEFYPRSEWYVQRIRLHKNRPALQAITTLVAKDMEDTIHDYRVSYRRFGRSRIVLNVGKALHGPGACVPCS